MAQIEIIPESIRLVKMTDKEYFGEGERDYISNSKLGLINPDEGGSLEKYLAGYSGEYSESFELGSAVHAIVLQPDEYNISPVRKPTGKLGLFAEKAYDMWVHDVEYGELVEKASKEADYYSGKMTEKRIETALAACIPYWKERQEYEKTLSVELLAKQVYLSAPMFEKYSQCVLGIKANSQMQETLYPQGLLGPAEVYNEYALFAEVIVTLDNGEIKRLKLKSKLDNFTVNHETKEMTLNDLKTTGKPVRYFMGNLVKLPDGSKVWYDGSFQKYHYYRQMGMYLWIMSCYLQHKGINYKPKANMVVVETIPDFKTKVYPVGGKDIKKGLSEFKKLLILVAENG